MVELIRRSQKLLDDTIAGKADEVSKAIEDIRNTQYAPTFYNDEQALRYVIKFAYIAAIEQYLKIEELPSGKGIADVVYLPKRKSTRPALVVELKWNKSSEGAIEQIKEKNYPAVIKDYGGEILLVGINYDEKLKTHSCVIERI
ncbi:MAG: PD-(D/E)XK nuclease domain-containing protein [Lachnospiraceae bacterium]|nr:PD-(D/E)XK nuclease domain-containing protein [Lachnospiraceae bacterium]